MFEDVAGMRERLQVELDALRGAGVHGADGRRDLACWVAAVGQLQDLLSTVQAAQTVALAHVAAFEDIEGEDGTVEEVFRGLGHQRLDAPDLVGDQLGLTASGATGRVQAAVDLTTRHTHVLAAMGAGLLDTYRASIVAEELAEAPPEVCAQVGERLAPHLGAEPGGALRRRCRRELAAVDAELLRQKAQRARGERSLRRFVGAPGVDEWSARLPVEDSRAAWSVVDDVARRYVTDGRCAGIEQARADALMDLIHARATGRVTVQVAVPASELVRAAQEVASQPAASQPAASQPAGSQPAGGQPAGGQPAGGQPAGGQCDAADGGELVPVSGFGMPGITHVRRSWLADVTGQAGSNGLARASEADRADRAGRTVEEDGCLAGPVVLAVACDDGTGALASTPISTDPGPVGRRARRVARRAAARAARAQAREQGRAQARGQAGAAGSGGPSRPEPHDPPQWMVEFVKSRDGHCRFPGCTVNARFCDVDHVVPWPSGATDPENLACLCRRHHRVKQRPRWAVRMLSGAVLVWTDPTGRERATSPIDYLHITELGATATTGTTGTTGTTSTTGTTATATDSQVAADLQDRAPAQVALPSRVEESLHDILDAAMVERACQPGLITAANREALRLGRPVNTSRVGTEHLELRCLGIRLDSHTPRAPMRTSRQYPHHCSNDSAAGHPGPDRRQARPKPHDPPPF